MKLVRSVNPELFEQLLSNAGACKGVKVLAMGDAEAECYAKAIVYYWKPNPNKDTLYTGADMRAYAKQVRAYDIYRDIEAEERACNQPGQDDLENMNAAEADDYGNEGY
jgi:hypothetical protein